MLYDNCGTFCFEGTVDINSFQPEKWLLAIVFCIKMRLITLITTAMKKPTF